VPYYTKQTNAPIKSDSALHINKKKQQLRVYFEIKIHAQHIYYQTLEAVLQNKHFFCLFLQAK
jgi:hypothetical protein